MIQVPSSHGELFPENPSPPGPPLRAPERRIDPPADLFPENPPPGAPTESAREEDRPANESHKKKTLSAPNTRSQKTSEDVALQL